MFPEARNPKSDQLSEPSLSEYEASALKLMPSGKGTKSDTEKEPS